MPRTTLDIDGRVLAELKRRSRARGTTVGQLASELLAAALRRGSAAPPRDPLVWHTQDMEALVDLRDKEAMRRATERP
ncbi:MAG TPA: hypothetical protein VFN99_10330 [Gaiella sp.]|jgi:hypothetical protein|nr:hypothetical protein [Gaiella sp.]